MAEIALVHGLWNRGWMMSKMAKRLRIGGHEVRVFSYPTRASDLDGHADALRGFITRSKTEVLHLVGHSMGGLVILNMLNRYDDLPPGRIVMMGTPVRGSGVVRRLGRLPMQKLLFGNAREDLMQGFSSLPADRETGMIRGTHSFGFGRVAGKQHEPNDGSVRVSETWLDGLKDTVELPVSHSGMLVSHEVVTQVEHFILFGRFKKDT